MKNKMKLVLMSLIFVGCATSQNREPNQVTGDYGKSADSKMLTLYSKDKSSALTLIGTGKKGFVFKVFIVNQKGHTGEISGIQAAPGEEVTTVLDGINCEITSITSIYKAKNGEKKLRVDLSQAGECEGLGLGVRVNETFKEK